MGIYNYIILIFYMHGFLANFKSLTYHSTNIKVQLLIQLPPWNDTPDHFPILAALQGHDIAGTLDSAAKNFQACLGSMLAVHPYVVYFRTKADLDLARW